ncbi:hypothetical protein [uncultured Dokdonia sp.]|uniref:hypothetical protein n=1 Tax=uncultured Dokdonia sp. TaxID=575653 RepID=UPI002609FF50|nr:hypothetical protein [uncultured Dokdonia sp.]
MKTKIIVLSLATLALIIIGCTTETDTLITTQVDTNIRIKTIPLSDFENLINITDKKIENSNRLLLNACVEEERYVINWTGSASVNSPGFQSVRDTTILHFENLGLDLVFAITPSTDRELWIFNYENFAPVFPCPGSQTESEIEENPVVNHD